jgi:hypothetical protein
MRDWIAIAEDSLVNCFGVGGGFRQAYFSNPVTHHRPPVRVPRLHALSKCEKPLVGIVPSTVVFLFFSQRFTPFDNSPVTGLFVRAPRAVFRGFRGNGAIFVPKARGKRLHFLRNRRYSLSRPVTDKTNCGSKSGIARSAMLAISIKPAFRFAGSFPHSRER